jgi:hypothetical protein
MPPKKPKEVTKDETIPNQNLLPNQVKHEPAKPATIVEEQLKPMIQTERNALEQIPKETRVPDVETAKIDLIKYPKTATRPDEIANPTGVDEQAENVNRGVKNVEPQPDLQDIYDTTRPLNARVDYTNSDLLRSDISNINQLPPVRIEPADLSRVINEPELPQSSTVTTVIQPTNIFEILPSSVCTRVVDRPTPFVTTASISSSLYESSQGQRIAPTVQLFEVLFKTSATKYVPENVSIMSIVAAWNDNVFEKYGIHTKKGITTAISMYTKRYAPANPIANTRLEEYTGRSLMMMVLMYEPKVIVIDNKTQLMSIDSFETDYSHLRVLNGETVFKPPSDSIALAVPSMYNTEVAKEISARIEKSNWRLGRIAAITDDNGMDVMLDIADDIDHITAYAYNEIAKRTMDQTMTASEFGTMIDLIKIPGTEIQLIDTTDRTIYHHDFIENPRASELVFAAACMHPEFARSLRPRMIQYLRSSGAITENLSGRAEDGTSMEPGYLEFMTKFRMATASQCVDAFYSSQIPKVTIPGFQNTQKSYTGTWDVNNLRPWLTPKDPAPDQNYK